MELFKQIVDVSTYSHVIEWNKVRNNLEFKPQLERIMILEEIREYIEADNFIDKTDAMCDIVFVALGSFAKISYNPFGADQKPLSFDDVIPMDTIDFLFADFYGQALSHGIDNNAVLGYFNECFKAVVEANEQKGTKKDENGKVIKPKDFVPPEARIEKIFKHFTTPQTQGNAEAIQELQKGVGL